MRKDLGKLLEGWEVKKAIIRPVIVNLLTAGGIFLCAILLKDPLYALFTPPPKIADWPLYCVLEPRPTSVTDPMIIDLFIVNIGGQDYQSSALEDLAKARSRQDQRAVSAVIEIDLKGSIRDEKILSIPAEDDFNRENGSLKSMRVVQDDWSRWTVTVEEIRKAAVLKAAIMTTVHRPVSSRASCGTLPVVLRYARWSDGDRNPCDVAQLRVLTTLSRR